MERITTPKSSIRSVHRYMVCIEGEIETKSLNSDFSPSKSTLLNSSFSSTPSSPSSLDLSFDKLNLNDTDVDCSNIKFVEPIKLEINFDFDSGNKQSCSEVKSYQSSDQLPKSERKVKLLPPFLKKDSKRKEGEATDFDKLLFETKGNTLKLSLTPNWLSI